MSTEDASSLRDWDAAALVEAAQGPALATDTEGVVRHWNHPAATLLGFSDSHAVGRHFDSLLGPRDAYDNPLRHGNLPLVDMALEGHPVHPFELSVRDVHGERLTVQVSPVVVLGQVPGDHRLVYLLEQRFRRRRSDEVIERLLRQAEEAGKVPPARRQDLLTPRQNEVLRLLAQGEGPQEIADELGVSIFTVRSHLRAVFAKLEAHSQSEAVAKAFQLRLL